MIASLFIKNKNLFQKSSQLVNRNIYKFSFQDQEKKQQTQEEKEAEINENMNTYFKFKVQEIFANKVLGYPLMQSHQISKGETFYFKQQLFKTTFLSSLGGLGTAYIYQALGLPTLIPLIAMIYIPKFFLIESPMEVVKSKDTGFIKIENSYKQKALYGLMTACTGIFFQSFLKTSIGFIPIFAFYNAYLFNLQQKNALTEVNGVKGIAALNLMFFLQNYTSQDPVSLAHTLFLGSVGNNLFLFAYTFFICNQQKISELAVKHGFLDELNTIFASFRYQQLTFQSYSWKHKSLVVALAFFLMIFQIVLREQRSVEKIDPNEEPKDKTYQKDHAKINENMNKDENTDVQSNKESQKLKQKLEQYINQQKNKQQNDEDSHINNNSNYDNYNDNNSSFNDNKFENYKDDFNSNDKDNFNSQYDNNYQSNNSNYNNDDQWGSKIDFSSSSNTNEEDNFQFDNTISYGKQKFSDE